MELDAKEFDSQMRPYYDECTSLFYADELDMRLTWPGPFTYRVAALVVAAAAAVCVCVWSRRSFPRQRLHLYFNL